MTTETPVDIVDINRIMTMIPHRYPFLLIDRVTVTELGERAVGLKNVTINEPFFQGHFPGHPVMPGVLIIEAMAQTACILVVKTLGSECEGKLVYFMSIEEAKFRRPVLPGDQVHLEVTKIKNRGMIWKLDAKAKVDGQLVAEAVITAMIRD